MLNKEDYRNNVIDLQQRGWSMFKIATILDINPTMVSQILSGYEPTERIKLKIVSNYDEWRASKIK